MTTSRPAPFPAPARPGPTAPHNRVVVGMDGDPVSVAALRFAAVEAAYRGGDVLAVHVWHYPSTWGAWGVPTVWPDETNPGIFILEQLQQSVDVVLAERAATGEPIVAITAQVMEGASAATLTAAARGAALLVLGARHHNRLLGSVSEACISHASCPIAVVPAAGAASR